MIDLKVKHAKGLFFDRELVQSKVDKAERKVLSRIGAFIRTAARGLIRSRKKTSKPGSPPRSITGLLKKFIFFVWDPEARSAIIGPARLNAKSGGVAPRTLEEGGRTEITAGKHRGEQVDIDARPYMGPAYAKESPKLPAMWRNSVK